MAAFAADDDVSVSLALKGSRTQFRMGEIIPMELRYRADQAGKYRVTTFSNPHWESSVDQLTAEPKEGTADPNGDMPPCHCASSGMGHSVQALASDAVAVDRDANDWISFRKGGHYRIAAETSRVTPVRGKPGPVKLRSNAVEIEIVAPEPGWAEKQIADAEAVLGAEPKAAEKDQVHAARVLRFLETREAVDAMVRFFKPGPLEDGVEWELRVGFFGSPYRSDVIASLEKALAASDTAITPAWMETMVELAGQEPHYFAMLADAAGHKTATARAMSLLTVFIKGPQPPAPAVVKGLIENYRSLGNGDQQMLLINQWPYLASPEILPMVRSIAEDTQCCARDSGLLRLFEMDPQAARPIILERIRKGDVVNALRVMMSLPDQTLPDLDGALADELENGNASAGALIDRYATAAILPRVRAWYEGKGKEHGAALLPYFFRVDPAYAGREVAEGKKGNPVLGWSGPLDLIMTPEMERAAIDEMNASNTYGTLPLLQNAGSSAAEQPVWDAFQNLRNTLPRGSNVGNIEEFFARTLMEGSGWVLTPEKIDRLSAICQTERCRNFVEKERGKLKEPIRIELLPEGTMSAMIGPYHLWSLDQVKSKISQFPAGTNFQFDEKYLGTWFAEQRTKAIRGLLDAAGMRAP
jgi:hypothetical protein